MSVFKSNDMIFSLKELVEKQVREAFEARMNTAFSVIENDMRQKFEAKITECKKDIKKQANSMTLEVLHKLNLNGLSVEFKV